MDEQVNTIYRIVVNETVYNFGPGDYDNYVAQMQRQIADHPSYYASDYKIATPAELQKIHADNAKHAVFDKIYISEKNAKIRISQLKNTFWFLQFDIEYADLEWKAV